MDGQGGQHLRGLARRVQGCAEDVVRVAALAESGAGVRWESLAADRFRRELAEEAARVRRCAGLLDEAAQALLRQAAALDGPCPPGMPGWLPAAVLPVLTGTASR